MKSDRKINIEVCATSVMSAIAADKGGADRIELCDNIAEGGTTPSAGTILYCTENLSLDVWILLRPRGGDFLYNEAEFELMKQDIKLAKEYGVAGIVTGVLTPDGFVDMERMQELIEVSGNMPVAFHRAFDMASDPIVVLNQLIDLNIPRLLTAGQKNTAMEGAGLIRELIEYADGRIDIMPGSGINLKNFTELYKLTGAKDFHLTGRNTVNSRMDYITDEVVLNSFGHKDDFQWLETDAGIIAEIVRLSKE